MTKRNRGVQENFAASGGDRFTTVCQSQIRSYRKCMAGVNNFFHCLTHNERNAFIVTDDMTNWDLERLVRAGTI